MFGEKRQMSQNDIQNIKLRHTTIHYMHNFFSTLQFAAHAIFYEKNLIPNF